MLLRRAMHRRGYRYRLNDRSLPGSPDIVLRRHRTCIFVHGCFWHRHDCRKSTVPKENAEFWRQKFEANVARDIRKQAQLLAMGYRVITVWECSLRGRTALPLEEVVDKIGDWLKTEEVSAEIGTSKRSEP
jgi:DNA mismatch endonuclease (patch repair protein)